MVTCVNPDQLDNSSAWTFLVHPIRNAFLNALTDLRLDILPESFTTEFLTSQEESDKAICVIGAGPAGLAALKAVLDTPQYKRGLWKPVAFEARDDVGGVW